jgi:DNA polymerase-3 subunit alpha
MEKFWTQLEEFAAYCFNKVHSACYGLIAYQTAYLKANYPAAYMAALMTSDYDNTDRLAIEITECKNMGIEVLSPDVNQSFHEFGIVPGKNQIRFGLDAVKNVGHGAVEEILRAREVLGGKFEKLEDFLRTVSAHIVNRKALESLIKAGALDGFGERGQMFDNIENMQAFASRLQKDASSGQVDLFSEDSDNQNLAVKLVLDKSAAEYPQAEQLNWERELLGLYLSHHPLEAYEALLAERTAPISFITPEMDGRSLALGGSIVSLRDIVTRNGAKMAFISIADKSGEIEVVVFPRAYQTLTEPLQRDQVVIVKGKLGGGRGSRDDSELKLLADEIQLVSIKEASEFQPSSKNIPPPEETQASQYEPPISKQRLYIRLENSANQSLLLTLKEKLDDHRGETEVVLVTGAPSAKQVIKLPQTISINESSLRALADIFGSTNVVVR